MKYRRLRLIARFKYKKKLTEHDLNTIKIMIKFQSPIIIGNKEQVDMYHNLSHYYKKWYVKHRIRFVDFESKLMKSLTK